MTRQPLIRSTGLSALADDFEEISHHLPLAYSKPGPDRYDLSDTLEDLGVLVAELSTSIGLSYVSQIRSTRATPHPDAGAASTLARAGRAAGQAISALSSAQEDQIFIDHYASLSSQHHYRANADNARLRIGVRLTTARNSLTEATTVLRSGAAQADVTERRVLAARARSPQANATGTHRTSPPPDGPSTPPSTSPGRRR
jgi:hypothetical protein